VIDRGDGGIGPLRDSSGIRLSLRHQQQLTCYPDGRSVMEDGDFAALHAATFSLLCAQLCPIGSRASSWPPSSLRTRMTGSQDGERS
jgi:hypothetical protein